MLHASPASQVPAATHTAGRGRYTRVRALSCRQAAPGALHPKAWSRPKGRRCWLFCSSERCLIPTWGLHMCVLHRSSSPAALRRCMRSPANMHHQSCQEHNKPSPCVTSCTQGVTHDGSWLNTQASPRVQRPCVCAHGGRGAQAAGRRHGGRLTIGRPVCGLSPSQSGCTAPRGLAPPTSRTRVLTQAQGHTGLHCTGCSSTTGTHQLDCSGPGRDVPHCPWPLTRRKCMHGIRRVVGSTSCRNAHSAPLAQRPSLQNLRGVAATRRGRWGPPAAARERQANT